MPDFALTYAMPAPIMPAPITPTFANVRFSMPSGRELPELMAVMSKKNAFVMFFARVIAGILRNATDERMSGMVYFMIVMVLQMVLGIFGMMIVAWFSRAREFRADAGAGTLAGRGKMIAALQRLQQNTRTIETGHPALATMKISGARSWMALLTTHPPLEDRIAALQNAR